MFLLDGVSSEILDDLTLVVEGLHEAIFHLLAGFF
jgi:hypothetical protein